MPPCARPNPAPNARGCAGSGHRRQTLKALAGTAGMALLGPWRAAAAAPGGLPSWEHQAVTPEWAALSDRLWPGRSLIAGQQVVQLQVPLRAAYGASVPVKVVAQGPQRPERHVRRLHLVVDKNPSPLAISLTLGQALGRADLETRLRVDEYSHVRVVAELSNGELHTDSRYVKTSGGCSAPPNREAPHLIGRTHIRLLGAASAEGLQPAEVVVIHPNDTGFELNQQTVMFIPPHFVRSLRMTLDDTPLFDADMDFSVSENPTLRFMFQRPAEARGAVLRAEVVDSKDIRHAGSLTLD